MSDTNKKAGTNKILWIVIAAIVVLAIVLAVIATTSGGKKSGGSNDAITDGTGDSAVEVYEGPQFYLSINADGGNTHIYSGHVRIEENNQRTLLDIMQEIINQNGGVVTDGGAENTYITSICGFAEDAEAGTAWSFTINGEANTNLSYVVADGDEIAFVLK